MKQRIIRILIVVVALIFIILAGGGYYFSGQVITPKPWGYEKTWKTEIKLGKIVKEQWDAWQKEEVYITTPDGIRLHGFYFPLKKSKKSVIIIHGHNYSLFGSGKYIPLFRKRGFNTLIFDNRSNGKSSGEYSTFGYYEKNDVRAWINWLIKKTGPDTLIGLHGESMGASVALLTAAEDKRVAFVVSDCAFSDLPALLKLRMKLDFGLPPFPLYHAASLCSRLRGAMFFGDVSPRSVAGKISIPVFFVHGEKDDFVPPVMARQLYRAKKTGIKKLYIAPGAKHAMSYWKNRAEYDRLLGKFLREGKIQKQ